MTEYEQALTEHLASFLTPHRRARFAHVLDQRTRWITVALVDLYQQHNASAVLRTCEAFGVQDAHIVERIHDFETNPQIALGTDRWLTLHRYGGDHALEECLAALRERGYAIGATVLHEKSQPVAEISLDRPIALLFGTEKDGLPRWAVEQADLLVHVPMYGFVESFNVSVAAALCLQELVNKLRASALPWHLSAEERSELTLQWSRISVPGADAIERRFLAAWPQVSDVRRSAD